MKKELKVISLFSGYGTQELALKYRGINLLAEAGEDPCWAGYTQYGTKTDESGREVPNCIPDEKDFQNWVQRTNLKIHPELVRKLIKPEDDVNCFVCDKLYCKLDSYWVLGYDKDMYYCSKFCSYNC